MPSVLIEVRQNYPQQVEVAIMDAVHSALVECFRILPKDKNVRLIAHEPHRFACPPDREQPQYYTHISIDCFSGRSVDAKRLLYQTIVKNLGVFSIPPDHIKILLREISRENWGIRGGNAACDIELGYNLNV